MVTWRDREREAAKAREVAEASQARPPGDVASGKEPTTKGAGPSSVPSPVPTVKPSRKDFAVPKPVPRSNSAPSPGHVLALGRAEEAGKASAGQKRGRTQGRQPGGSAKGKAAAEGSLAKKQKRNAADGPETSLKPSAEDGVCESRASAALLLSSVIRSGMTMTPPDTLMQQDLYAEMALRGTAFLDSINQLAHEYDRGAWTNSAQAEEDQKKILELGAEVEKAAKEADEHRSTMLALEKKYDATKKHAEYLKASKHRRDLSIIDLRNQLIAAEEAHRKEVQRAVDGERNQLTARFQERLACVRAQFAKVKGEAHTEMIDLGQIESNLQLVMLLKGEAPPDLDEEMKGLEARIATLQGADARFKVILGDLERSLLPSPPRSASVVAPRLDYPVESLAASFGVTNVSGSNQGNVAISELGSQSVDTAEYSESDHESLRSAEDRSDEIMVSEDGRFYHDGREIGIDECAEATTSATIPAAVEGVAVEDGAAGIVT